MKGQTILYVEDDETLSFVTSDNLKQKGYNVFHYVNGQEALKAIAAEEYDLAILDIMLPDIDGFELAKEIRKRTREIPILFLSAKSLKEDRLKGFEIGADDYISKPFSIEELLFKVEIFLKRRKISGPDHRELVQFGRFELDFPKLELRYEEEIRILTPKEAAVMKFLVSHPNQIVKRSTMLEQIWGENDYFMGRSLDVFISRIRKYLQSDPHISIENIHGVGFTLKIKTPV